VKIFNQTQKQFLTEKTEIADSFFTRVRGLIGHTPLNPGEGMIIRPCNGVHCMFMSFPIDVIFVNKQWQVVHIEDSMSPWKIGGLISGAAFVIETAAGHARATKTGVGDQLEPKYD